MTLDSLREMNTTLNTSRLDGGDIESISREGDLQNLTSIGTTAVYTAKVLFRENTPYEIEYIKGSMIIVFNIAFLKELRRQLSGEAVSSNFVPKSQIVYDQYLLYIDGIIPQDEIDALVVEALNKWIVDEVQELEHPYASRVFSETHKWNKLTEETDQDFTIHPWFKVLKREE